MDYQGNSKKQRAGAVQKPPDKKIEKVVTGAVATKPKPLGEKFKSLFLGHDVKGVLQYIAAEVLFPAARNAIVDATTKGIERAVYGESTLRPPRRGGYGPRTTYNSPVSRDPRSHQGYLPDQSRRHAINSKPTGRDIILSSREEADLVVERLSDIINQYDFACLADLFELVGLPSSYTDQKWGWTFLPDIEVRQVREGWLLDLPPVDPI